MGRAKLSWVIYSLCEGLESGTNIRRSADGWKIRKAATSGNGEAKEKNKVLS